MRALCLFGACALLAGCPQRSIEDTLPAYSRAFDTVFRSLGDIELSSAQSRIKSLGDAGRPFQAELDELRRAQGEVNDLMVKAVRLKKQALEEKKPAAVEDATRILGEAELKAQQAITGLKRLNEKLTAAGAPVPEPAPERDPNARD